ncbi:hypothetical protein G6F62_001856 [Rhizopus arrhizus]|uniref:Uncharacterized protein n=1 Tax=Rhizopus oryzae TaxID=64495 RepID=A0A9P7BSY4_RHIOR|nr:hypothetical protein G6F23_001489 [Rhizopus arrhizus]KAG0766859.1 hypothetical protein G6F24_003273 [Rhizopus arrhizus]KAG0796259.1 hypothetical protein G6F21_001450 [Rhizopus arrhizus]KAG0801929.1 hypothetical protein G6F22_000757 [Rhizopus arrhizus]KAG0816802.1 hypothetical protein G6F20_002915 [Rhizopus arrhizus]
MGATDSKLAFRKTVFRLYEDKDIPTNKDEFWSSFWNLPESVDDIFSLIGANDIRRIRDSSKVNLETLIDKVLDKMKTILSAKNFPSEQHSINHLLNCCRIMTRLMPFIFESTECLQWEESFFWAPRQQEKETRTVDNKPEYEILPCRAESLLTMTIQALYLAGFTLPISAATEESKVVYTIWENGVGSSVVPISTSKDAESNRTEVLRLLTVLLSKSMYTAPAQLLSEENFWLRFIATKLEKKVLLVILCSLINTVCNYDPTGWMPYTYVLSGSKEQLVSFSLACLLALLDYRSPQQADMIRQVDSGSSPTSAEFPVTNIEVITLESPDVAVVPKTSVELEVFSPQDQASPSTSVDNAFRHYVSKLHRPKDFEFLTKGLYRILVNPMTAVNTYLPGSTKRVGCFIEVMMFCWRLLEINSRFKDYLVENDQVLDLTVALVFHATENKNNLAQVGLVRMCAFMLQTLSSSKGYCTKLNQPFATHSSLPSIIRLYAFNGTYADFLIISIFSLIASTRGLLSSLYPALVLTITNISPYAKNLGVTTASKLMGLFHSMSSPGFLLNEEHNHLLGGYLLEAFNNIIHHQYSENPNFVYSMILHHDYFEKLDKLTFGAAVTEAERLRSLRESKEGKGTNPGSKETDKQERGSSEEEANKPQEEEESNLRKEEEQAQTTAESSSANDDGSSGTIFVSKTGFTPTEEWFETWKSKLPLVSILKLLESLVPSIEEKCKDSNITLEEIKAYLSTVSTTDILTEGNPIFIRKFQWGEALFIWFRSMLWGHNYVSTMKDYGPWNGTHVKLFQIKQG